MRTLHRTRRFSPALPALALAALCALFPAAQSPARADEPGLLSKERWTNLTEIQFAELKSAEDTFRKKAYTAARNAYEKFMTVNSKSDVATYCQLMMGECLRLNGKPNEAISDFQFVRDLAEDSDDAKWAYLRIAQSHRQAGNAEKAALIYKEIFKDNGTHVTAFVAVLELVDVLESQNKLRDRAPYLDDFAERFLKKRYDGWAYQRAIHTLAYEKLLAGSPDVAFTLLKTVEKSADAERTVLNIGSNAVRDLSTKETVNRRDALAEALTNMVMAWLRENKDRTNHQDLTRGVVFLYINIGKGEEGAKQALAARKIYSDARWTLELMVDLYRHDKKMDKAVATASEARRIHKDADWTLDMYAEQLKDSGDLGQAVSAWDLMKDRRHALFRSSDALRHAGKITEAIERRRKISELDPTAGSEVAMWIGDVLEQSGKYDEAIKEYLLAQNEPRNLYQIAECKSKQKKYKEAIEQYSTIAAAFEKETPEAMYRMALEYEKLSDTTTAINFLRRICRTFPKSQAASSAHVRLQSKYKIDETLGGSEGDKKD